jgi:hypothetical protein
MHSHETKGKMKVSTCIRMYLFCSDELHYKSFSEKAMNSRTRRQVMGDKHQA